MTDRGKRDPQTAPKVDDPHLTRRGTVRTRGPNTSDGIRAARPLTRAETETIVRTVQHSLCVEHVRIDGLAEPVCITKRDDREQILADARELAAIGKAKT